MLDIVSVYHLLEGDSDLNLTKSLHFIPIRPGQIHPQTKKMARLRVIKLLPPFKDLGLDSDAQYHYDLWQITQRLYGKLVNLQTLIIQDPRLNFTFTRVVNGKLVPYTFLTNSLTKLYIGLRPEEDQHLSLNASNVVWLSLFCPHLRQLAVGFSIDLQDFHYLSDYAETFDGLSRVKEVAFQVFFKYTPDPKTWWGTPREANRGWKGDNKKTQAVYNILRAYRSLNSFEIFSSFQSRNPGDSSSIHSSCLLGLHNSFQSLQVLRLFGVGSDIQKPDSWDYSMFHNLKELSTEGNSIIPFHQFVQIKIPESLEIITLAYYSLFFKGIGDHKVGEEAFLAKFLKLHSLPKLKEVRVPAKLIDGTGLPRIEKEDRDAWIRKRKILKNLDIIKSGKVKLVEWKDGKPGKQISQAMESHFRRG